jgi:hypothetical protein
MWPFKPKSNAAVLAEKLYRNCVVEETNNTALRLKDLHLTLSEDQKKSFISKHTLYREAAVLRVLLTERVRDHATQSKHLEDLLQAFEKLIFGSKPSAWAANKLVAIKSAMKSLDELFTQNKEPTWSRNWLLDIGYDETNFVALAGFALFVGNDTKMLRELVRELIQILD